MPPPPLLSLRDVAVTIGGRTLFHDVSLALTAGERVCLLGRNGSGKSTLMRVIRGLIEPDAGERFAQPGLRIAALEQDPTFDRAVTAFEHAAAIEDGHAPEPHEVAAALDRLDRKSVV